MTGYHPLGAAGLLGQWAGIVPVLAFQGGSYVVAGLAMLAALRRESRAAPAPGRVTAWRCLSEPAR